MRLVLACAVTLVVAGCSAFGLGSGFEVEAVPPALQLDNGLGRTVYYIAIEAEDAALVDLNPDVTAWARLGAGDRRSIPYESLDGYDDGDTRAYVFWSTGSGYEREEVRL